MSCPHKPPTLVQLAGAPRELPKFWRDLEHLAGDPDFEARLAHEFPRHASVWDENATDRRRFLQLMAASLALAGAHGCSSPPPETIMPYVRQPEGLTPGVPLHFATAMPRSDGAMGLVVTSHMGRPTKVEGNPLHPASLGATDAFAQASLLTLYDPDRSQTVTQFGVIATWGDVLGVLRGAFDANPDGAGVHVLSPPSVSPTLARQRAAFLAKYPQAKWHQYEPAGRDAAVAALGQDVRPIYHFDNADVVLSIDADFLCSGSRSVRYAHDFMSRRGAESAGAPNRLYSIESAYTPTGSAADHRWPLCPSSIEHVVHRLAARLGVSDVDDSTPAKEQEIDAKLLDALVDDLQSHTGRSIVVAGTHLPSTTQALIYAINDALGSVGSTVSYLPTLDGETDGGVASLRELADELNAEAVNLLLILDANPVYNAPVELQFATALRKARLAVHYGLYQDETAEFCPWHIPATHYLESWSDARAFDGTAAIVQPLIAPLYEGKTVHEVLSALVDPAPMSSYDLVRATWQEEFGEEFETRWHDALRDGHIAES